MKRITGLLLLLLLTGCGGEDIETNMSREIIELSAVNQHHEQVNVEQEMEGEYWITNLIFTSCTTVCPPMTGNMARLQNELEEEGLDTRLASFTVDPDTDDVETLKDFAEDYQPDFDRWSFYTGYSFEEIKEFSIKSFQSPLQKLDNSDQFAHATGFFLVTPDGEVIKNYQGTNSEAMEKIISDLKQLDK
ncbi:SCO family protein [Salimicrobium halophilum]|uniref:Protein SCO1/2 n=1 Tax=Salimicrobium halophilum TaxID=86666 RepID=A0A1G8RP41_9BACI|nr:SCO family protein [Salimicrobium halophilum]SDJ18682.1 protein SCO1/2 [Salimicrobium halophilum]